MKKALKIIGIAAVVALIAGLALYLSPKTFLRGVEPEQVSSITVFNGNTGSGSTITDSEQIREIVENIGGTQMKREGVSLGYMGYTYRLGFIGENGKVIDEFVLNSSDCIRDDPFFYCCDGGLCFDYIAELEKSAQNGT